MKNVAALLIALFVLTTTIRMADAQQPSAPSYLVLQPPSAHHGHRAAHPSPHHRTQGQPATLYPVPTTGGYAYGWFGARPRTQWSRHLGYYRAYTQWTGR
jgi:hypothetical protein